MLTSGVVPALFAQEDKDGMMDDVQDGVKALGMVDTRKIVGRFLLIGAEIIFILFFAFHQIGMI
jgi:hypothetical protein